MANTTLSWKSSGGNLSGFWGDSAHWAPVTGTDTTPTFGDTAWITATGADYTVSIGSAGGGVTSELISNLVVNSVNATLNFVDNGSTASFLTYSTSVELDAGTIDVENLHGLKSGSATGTITVTGGKLLENGGTVSVGTSGTGSSFTVSGGTVALNGGLTNVLGTASFTGGTDTISNTFSAATVSLSGAGTTVTISGGSVTDTTGQMTVGTGSILTLAGGTVASTTGGILNSGTISGYGTISTGTGIGQDLGGSGKVIATGGALVVGASANLTAPAFSIANNSTLEFTNKVGSLATVTFGAGSNETLFLASTGTTDFTATVSAFAVGDTIKVAGANSYTVNGVNVRAYSGTNATGNLLQQVAFAITPHSNETVNSTVFTVCFAAGSRIRTADGDVPVEQLREGQPVAVLRDGAIAYTPITWIGERRINLSAHPQPQTAAPVRIRQGAIGENLPERDLVLSPDHCLFLDGRLIPAKALINGMTIVQERWLPAVHYFHVEVDPHAVLLAEGLPVESYLDTGNRAYFQNAGAALVLHPEFTVNAGLKAWETHACAPLTVQPEAVKPVWQRLADRAAAMGAIAPQPETSHDADLHIVADGRSIRPMKAQDGRYVFALPANCDSVRLVSRATIPSDIAAYLDDWRSIGVAVSQLVVRAHGVEMVIPADHPALLHGWHSPETDGATSWRWTDGNAELALDAAEGPAILEVHVCNTTRYILASGDSRQRLAA